MGFEEVFLSSAIGPIQHAARKVKLSPELANVVRLVQHLGWAWSNEYAEGIGPTTFSARSAQVPGRKQQGGNFAILPSAPGESLQDNTGMGPLPSDVGTQARLKEFDFYSGLGQGFKSKRNLRDLLCYILLLFMSKFVSMNLCSIPGTLGLGFTGHTASLYPGIFWPLVFATAGDRREGGWK